MIHTLIKLSAPERKGYWEIPILHEDDSLLAIDKPSSLLTSPDRYDPDRPNVMRLLHESIQKGSPWAKERNLTYLMNAHRLDFETSGILLLAKNKPALIFLANLFGTDRPKKEYAALMTGSPASDDWTIEAKLSPHPYQLGLMRIDPKNGKKSLTRFKVERRFSGIALVHAFPETGRTHQIRIHARHSSHPLIGDSVYGGRALYLSQMKRNYVMKKEGEERPLMGRVALHAHRLALPHPVTNEMVSIESPLPKDFTVALKYLERYATGATPQGF